MPTRNTELRKRESNGVYYSEEEKKPQKKLDEFFKEDVEED